MLLAELDLREFREFCEESVLVGETL